MKRLPVGLFFLALVLFIATYVFMIQHFPAVGVLLLLGLMTHILMIGLIGIEIVRSKAKDGDKFTWILLLIGTLLAGIFFYSVIIFWFILFAIEAAYLFSGRRKMVGA